MSEIRLYVDEDASETKVILGLRARGIDLVTTVEAGRLGVSDQEQLEFAIHGRRVLYTFNAKDFARLHREFLANGRSHTVRGAYPPGVRQGKVVVARLDLHANCHDLGISFAMPQSRPFLSRGGGTVDRVVGHPRPASLLSRHGSVLLSARPPTRRSLYPIGQISTHDWCEAMLNAIATHVVGGRPDRFEPRERKRRPKNYKFMVEPRQNFKRRAA